MILGLWLSSFQEKSQWDSQSFSDWLQFAQSIVKGPMNLVSSPTDTCVFTASGIIMVI